MGYNPQNIFHLCFFLIWDENNECLPCSKYCSECLHASDYCPKCKDNAIADDSQAHEIVQVGNFCFTKEERDCGAGYYKDELTGDCKLCDVTCVECDGPLSTNCIMCPNKRPNMQNKACLVNCDAGYYVDEQISRCLKWVSYIGTIWCNLVAWRKIFKLRCNKNCLKCERNSSSCVECKQGFNLDAASKQCVRLTLFNEKCHQTCYECNGPNKDQCLVCKNDLYVSNSVQF